MASTTSSSTNSPKDEVGIFFISYCLFAWWKEAKKEGQTDRNSTFKNEYGAWKKSMAETDVNYPWWCHWGDCFCSGGCVRDTFFHVCRSWDGRWSPVMSNKDWQECPYLKNNCFEEVLLQGSQIFWSPSLFFFFSQKKSEINIFLNEKSPTF